MNSYQLTSIKWIDKSQHSFKWTGFIVDRHGNNICERKQYSEDMALEGLNGETKFDVQGTLSACWG